MSKQQQFTPRNGRNLRVIIVARISTIHQDMKSLDDQVALCKDYVTRRFSGPIEWTPIATQGSGEWLDREEILRLGELIESRKFDLVVTEDLGRICRSFQVIAIAEACQDSETRLIALNDGVDTDDESWKPLAAISALRHESYNKDTGNRIRRSHRHRFTQGGVIGCLLFCYEREPGAKTIDKVCKKPEMIPIVEGIFEKLESGATFSEVARWLNKQNIPKGTRGKVALWDAGNVGEFMAELEKLPKFDETLLSVMKEEAEALTDERVVRRGELEKRLRETESSLASLMKVLIKMPDSEAVLAQLSSLEKEKKSFELELRDLRRAAPPAFELPSVEVLREEFRREASSITGESPEFCRLMRKIIPGEIVIRPYKAVLGNVVVCRAKFALNLGAFLPKDQRTPAIEAALTRSLEVEVDERAQHHAFAISVGRMREEGKNYKEIGAALGITDTAAQHAMKVYKAMQAVGVSDAFLIQREPLSGDKRQRRHLHPGYRFLPKKPQRDADENNG